MGLYGGERRKITVLTPTYNRANTLLRLYKSLRRQSNLNFSWMIVDDGSTDDTRTVVTSFEADFPINYIFKENGGKHTAVNLGISNINTPYTFIVDSDDYLSDNAIELVNQWIKDIAGVADFAGVAGLKLKNENREMSIIGQFPPGLRYIDCLNSERRQHGLSGDKAEVYKTELLKRFPFPEYKDEKFMPESVVWNRLSLEGYKVRWYREGIVVCEYLEGGLTYSMRSIKHFERNWKGYQDELSVSFRALKFPYNYSAASVFYAKAKALHREKRCLDFLQLTFLRRLAVSAIGNFRFILERY